MWEIANEMIFYNKNLPNHHPLMQKIHTYLHKIDNYRHKKHTDHHKIDNNKHKMETYLHKIHTTEKNKDKDLLKNKRNRFFNEFFI